MSYVMQNFNANHYLTPLNPRTRLMFTFRTLSLVSVLLKHNLLFWSHKRSLVDKLLLLKMWNTMFFDHGLEFQLKQVMKTPKAFHAHNLIKSMQFWAVTELTHCLSNHYTFSSKLPKVGSLPALQYNTPILVSNVSLHGKNYRKVLMNFLAFLVNNWTIFNCSYKITTQFLIVTPVFNLVRFYNFYYFKVYNF